MIRLTSVPSAEATARLGGYAQRFAEASAAGGEVPKSVANGYRHAVVKAAIVSETNGKCAYCESKIGHVYHGDVEHILPKSVFPERRFDYANLTFACAICNNRKGEYYEDQEPLLHPYTQDPGDHLIGNGFLVWHRNGSEIGQRTIDLLGLNRKGLWERRFERLERISGLADRYVRQADGPLKEVLRLQLREEVADSSEYLLVVRCFLRNVYDLDAATL